jgi:ECF transporter S component (folate family)
LNVVLSRFLSIATPVVKIGFTFLPIAFAAGLYGPIGGMLVAGLGDFIGALLFPIGPYFPGYTLTAAILGLIFGLFLYRRCCFWKIVVAVVATQLLCTLLLNTLWTAILYDKAFWAYLATRLVQSAIMTVVEIVAMNAALGSAVCVIVFLLGLNLVRSRKILFKTLDT